MLIKHFAQCLVHGNKCSKNGDYQMVMAMMIKDMVIFITGLCSLTLLINVVVSPQQRYVVNLSNF